MKDKCDIYCDKKNIYIELTTKPNIIVILGIIFLNLIFLTPVILFIIFFINPIPIIIFTGIWIFYAFRLLLWNFFGKEIITLNSKAVINQNSYGLLATQPNIYKYNHIELLFDEFGSQDNKKYGKLEINGYSHDYNIYENIYKTSFFIYHKDFDYINEQFNILKAEEEGHIVINLN